MGPHFGRAAVDVPAEAKDGIVKDGHEAAPSTTDGHHRRRGGRTAGCALRGRRRGAPAAGVGPRSTASGPGSSGSITVLIKFGRLAALGVVAASVVLTLAGSGTN